MLDIDEKIAGLKPRDNKDKEFIRQIRDQAVDYQVQIDFIGHPRTHELVNEYRTEMQEIDTKLREDDMLMIDPNRALERVQLATRRATLKRVIEDMTKDPTKNLEALEKQVDEIVARND